MRTRAVTDNTHPMRELDTRIVLDCIRRNEPIPRAAIARMAHLARPTVSGIVTDLLQRRLIVETGRGNRSTRRCPTLLELNAEDNYTLDVNLRVTDIDAAEVRHRKRRRSSLRLWSRNPASSVPRRWCSSGSVLSLGVHPHLVYNSLGVGRGERLEV